MGTTVSTPVFKVTFKKRGLTRKEFEDCLTSKVEELFKIINIPGIATLKKKTITKVRKHVCIQENSSNNRLDQRNPVSINEHISHGTLSNQLTTPMRDREDTGGQPGTQRSDRRITAGYHDIQHLLFSDSVLSQKLRNLFPDIILKVDNKGYFFHRHNEKMLTTVECCDVIDKITTEYIRAFHELRYPNHNYDQAWRDDLNVVYYYCREIVIGRVAVDWANDNNLMVDKAISSGRVTY
ncbi:hypothetical protein OS493_013834 [Desmophyllum pertusum]|uniref:Uncharacterized protein n=1 Tax=Desmophyllum pertusum TaxID=174260 RepID=A0A9X0D3R5_9CNID|nr:hypothetical protein OS493_013834 [Desmophyllum pertusum]